MKTIANIIIINSQNVKSEYLLAVIITSVFKEKNSVSAWMSSTEVANIGLPNLRLENLKSLRHRLAELHVIQVIAWNISACMHFYRYVAICLIHIYAVTMYSYNYKGMLSKSIP